MPLETTEFRKALAQLHYAITDFLVRWNDETISGRRTPKQKAAWMIWTRWAMAIRSLHHLHHEEDIPDCFTMARLCLELEASLMAVCKKGENGQAYLAFGDEVRVRAYRKMLERGDMKMAASVKHKLPADHEEQNKYRRVHWYPHQGSSGLIRDFGRKGDPGLYSDYCHMAHGNAIGNEIMFRALENGGEEASKQYDLDGLLWMCLARFIRSTQKFLKVAFGRKGNMNCSSDFRALEALLVEVTLFRDQVMVDSKNVE